MARKMKNEPFARVVWPPHRKWTKIAETHHCIRLLAAATTNPHIDSFHLISLDGRQGRWRRRRRRRWGVAGGEKLMSPRQSQNTFPIDRRIVFTKLRFASVFGRRPTFESYNYVVISEANIRTKRSASQRRVAPCGTVMYMRPHWQHKCNR